MGSRLQGPSGFPAMALGAFDILPARPDAIAHGRAIIMSSARETTGMGNAELPEPRPPRPAGIPRWLALALAPVVWLVALPAVHAGIPWALSHLGPRYGWADGGPSGWNCSGMSWSRGRGLRVDHCSGSPVLDA
jgi:hypothetical protein